MAYLLLSIIAGLISLYSLSITGAAVFALATLFMTTLGKTILALPILMSPKLFVGPESKMTHIAAHIRTYDWGGFIFAYVVFMALMYWYNHFLIVPAFLTFVADCFLKRWTEAVFKI